MSAYDARIHEVQVPIEQTRGVSLGLQSFEYASPDACLAPTIEAARHRSHCAVALGQVPPGRARAQHPENAVDDGAVVVIGAARPRPLRGQQRRQALPLLVRQLVTSHTLKIGTGTETFNPFADAP